MIDKVAAALEQRFKNRVSASAGQPFDTTGVISPAMDVWREYARAAVEAMCEPTGTMIEAAKQEDEPGEFAIYNAKGADHWRAMIDEALK